MFTGSTNSSTGRIRARFGGSFQSKSKATTATPFSSSSTILIVESSSSMPSTPDAPDCGSRSREMYTGNVDRFFLIFCMIFLLRGRQSGHLFMYVRFVIHN